MSSQNAPISDVDFATSIEASLAPRGLKILVHEKFQDQLRNKGFGELENSEYILQPYEACIYSIRNGWYYIVKGGTILISIHLLQ